MLILTEVTTEIIRSGCLEQAGRSRNSWRTAALITRPIGHADVSTWKNDTERKRERACWHSPPLGRAWTGPWSYAGGNPRTPPEEE